MDKRFGYFIFGGMLIGALFGSIGSGIPGIVIGALAGLAIGWFAAAAVMEQEKKKTEDK